MEKSEPKVPSASLITQREDLATSPELPPGELPGPPPIVKPEFNYNKELTPEQLQEVLKLSVNLEDAARYLAGILQLTDITFDARNLILLEFFLGIIMFGKHAALGIPQILVLYELGHMILDNIRGGKSFADSERTFKNRIIPLAMKNADRPVEPLFSAWDLQRITPYFTTTVFQHYCLYQYCLTKDHYNITKDEKIWVETPYIYPLAESKSTEELQAEEAARKEAAEKAQAEAEAAALKASQELFARLAAEAALRAEEELRRKPLTLQEAIEMAVRDKVLEAKKSFIAEYEHREKYLLDKVLQMQDYYSENSPQSEVKKSEKAKETKEEKASEEPETGSSSKSSKTKDKRKKKK